ncbi:MAG: flagellar biosynthesis repressor FlbT [Desulfococcaceae bacterium]
MALKLRLKPGEKVIIGGAVIANGERAADLMVENQVPILREKDILTEAEADSPCRRIYLAVQLMYIDEENLARYHKNYWELVKEVLNAAPSTKGHIEAVSNEILAGRYFQALKKTKKLIQYEEELLNHVR